MGTFEICLCLAKGHPWTDLLVYSKAMIFNQYAHIIVADSSRTLPGRSSGLFDSKQTKFELGSMQS